MKTTLDGLLNRRVTIEQPETGYRVAIDTVFLAAAVPAQAGEKILDMGCGVGGAMLCLATRMPSVLITGIDVQDDLVELCRRNIARNGFDERMNIVCGDVMQMSDTREQMSGYLSSDICPLTSTFDHVLMNPPYHDEARHDVSPDKIKRTANAGKGSDLPLWLDSAARALKPSGTLTLIHRADRLEEILDNAAGWFSGFEILPLLPAAGALPKRVILRARKDKNRTVRHCQPFILHEADGRYTAAAEGILRHAQALEFALG